MGDYEQLPSIEPGFVLKDIIEAGIVPVITLDVVKRQTEGSGVLYNANEILEGHMIRSRILNKGKIRNNAYIFRTDTNEECRNSIVDMVKKVRGWGYSIDDIQVICPQKKTDVGIYSLNYFIQEALNPSHRGKEVLSSVIQVRDKDGKIRDVIEVYGMQSERF